MTTRWHEITSDQLLDLLREHTGETGPANYCQIKVRLAPEQDVWLNDVPTIRIGFGVPDDEAVPQA